MKKYLLTIAVTTVTTAASVVIADYLYHNYCEKKILDSWFNQKNFE